MITDICWIKYCVLMYSYVWLKNYIRSLYIYPFSVVFWKYLFPLLFALLAYLHTFWVSAKKVYGLSGVFRNQKEWLVASDFAFIRFHGMRGHARDRQGDQIWKESILSSSISQIFSPVYYIDFQFLQPSAAEESSFGDQGVTQPSLTISAHLCRP